MVIMFDQSALKMPGALRHLFATLDVPALMSIQVFLLKLGAAFSPEVPTLRPSLGELPFFNR